jgi:diguanylate cyclase (GGDEF)-like protein/PAS domain S-box-containing protein
MIRRLLDAIFANTHDGMMLTTKEGTILQVNSALLHQCGYSSSELIGQNARFLKSNRHLSNFYRQMWQSLATKRQWQGEIWNRRKNGEAYKIWLKIIGIGNESNLHYLGICSPASSKSDEWVETIFNYTSYDPLTGLPYWWLFREKLAALFAISRRYSTHVALLYISLDGFKPINHLLGYQFGDQLLQDIVDRLQSRLRGADMMARIKGDCFAMALSDLKDISNATHVIQNILQWLQMPVSISGQTITIKAHIGVTFYPDYHSDPDTLLKQAQTAAFQAKKMNEGGFCIFKES